MCVPTNLILELMDEAFKYVDAPWAVSNLRYELTDAQRMVTFVQDHLKEEETPAVLRASANTQLKQGLENALQGCARSALALKNELEGAFGDQTTAIRGFRQRRKYANAEMLLTSRREELRVRRKSLDSWVNILTWSVTLNSPSSEWLGMWLSRHQALRLLKTRNVKLH